jgi:hypothetical protein
MLRVLLRTAAAAAVLSAAALGSPMPAQAMPLDPCGAYCLMGTVECMSSNNSDVSYCGAFYIGCYASCTTFYG